MTDEVLMRIFRSLMSISALAIAGALSASAPELQVAEPIRIESGVLQGVTEGGLTVYRGIPYAEPPILQLGQVTEAHELVRTRGHELMSAYYESLHHRR